MRFPEWKEDWLSATLDSICSFSKGSVLSKAHLSDDGLPCILYGQLYTTYLSEEIGSVLSRTKVSDPSIERSNDGDVIIPCSGETPEDIATARCIRIKGILYGGDLNVLKPRQHDGVFLAFQLNGRRRMDIAKIAVGKTIVHLHASDLKHLRIWFPKSRLEEEKIARFLSLINRRIELQNKIIEGLESLEKGIIHRLIWGQECGKATLGELLSERTEKTSEQNQFVILSSTATGLFTQEEYFNHQVASENNVGYKIVRKGDVILSPQNLWLGNINYNDRFECGMVSPSYKVFSIKGCHAPFLSLFLKTKRMKYLYGLCSEQGASVVRRNLNVEEFLQIAIPMPPMEVQKAFAEKILTIMQKHRSESKYRDLLLLQKKYLLENMFI
ncbi:MAG: restriction endonuclease subunit S [Erysipelotrichaceae bacterium]|nr:restriction endonuclease subunit S [Erysipelotrichaceae bacterium]